MCGIIGYMGKKEALPVLIDGLKRLEYRGYDSSGIAIQGNGAIEVVKTKGKIKNLVDKIDNRNIPGHVGIAHTRWATHGEPSEVNAHPHAGCKGDIQVVHNGIVENYQDLKKQLQSRGHKFISETDTEVISHLIEDFYEGDLTNALIKTLSIIEGAYGLVVIHKDEPNKMLVAKKGSPLLIGLGDNETIVASDASAIVRYTKQIIYLEDNEVAEIVDNDVNIFDFNRKSIKKEVKEIEWDLKSIEKEGFDYFMLKEIFEQSESISNSCRGRLFAEEGNVMLGGLDLVKDKLRDIEKIVIVACGTAYSASLIGEYMIEEYAGIPVEVDYSHEFRYRKQVLDKNMALIVVSQSGETADTLAAVKEAKEKGILTIGIVNGVGSSIARETDAGIYNHIGPEISVASTKAFTSQVVVLALLAVYLGRQRQLSYVMGKRIVDEIDILPEKIEKIIKLEKQIKEIAGKYRDVSNIAFLGRKYNYPSALEGAIKLKELSYIHAEGFASGEMKHGPLAMIDENFPSFFICPKDSVYEKNLSNMEEIKSRKGPVIAIATEGDEKIKDIADDIIYLPKTLEMLSPILCVIPMQLFAYHMAILNDRDVDKPRNLAKSVTVE